MRILGSIAHCLKKTSSILRNGIVSVGITSHTKKLSCEMLEELECVLLASDMGVDAVCSILDRLKFERFDKDVTDQDVLLFVKNEIVSIMQNSAARNGLLSPQSCMRSISPSGNCEMVNTDPQFRNGLRTVLLCGINGSGKTTTIGKLASRLQRDGLSVMIAGCDTFRTAASEQLEIWAKRAMNCPALIGAHGSDPASVVYQAVEQAKQSGTQILLMDTSGRLHNSHNLMQELSKCVKVARKADPNAQHDVVLVIDGTAGQNIFQQVERFSNAVELSGVIVAKLDGSSKGGAIIQVWQRYRIPIYGIGVGEGIDDLYSFDPEEFASAITGL